MTVIEPHLTGNDAPEVLLSTRSGSVLVVDMEDSNDMDIDSGSALAVALACPSRPPLHCARARACTQLHSCRLFCHAPQMLTFRGAVPCRAVPCRAASPFNNMVCSADGKFLACFSGSGQVLVYSSDFRQNIMEFNTKTTKKPHQVVWCGVDIVVLAYDKIMFCVGPAGDWINFRFDERFVLVAEDDGVRIVSSKTCEFLQRVPDCTVDVFEPGSTKPAALLYDAHEELFERQSAKADDQIRGIRDALPAAVETCIQAATHAPTVEQQKKLLKTAAYGKYFCEFYDSTEYVETCHSLRILNAVHDPAVGIYITHEQYKRLSPEVMIDRLILRRHYRLAKEICLALGIRSARRASHTRVYSHLLSGHGRAREPLHGQIRGALRQSLPPAAAPARLAPSQHTEGRCAMGHHQGEDRRRDPGRTACGGARAQTRPVPWWLFRRRGARGRRGDAGTILQAACRRIACPRCLHSAQPLTRIMLLCGTACLSCSAGAAA